MILPHTSSFFSFSFSLLPALADRLCCLYEACFEFMRQIPKRANAGQVRTRNTHAYMHTHIMSLCVAGSFVFPVCTSSPIRPTVKSLVMFLCVSHTVEPPHRVMVQVV